MEIDGLIYLLNQAGVALAQANERIAELARENDRLVAERGVRGEPPEPILLRNGVQVYEVNGNFVMATGGQWLEGTYRTPDEAVEAAMVQTAPAAKPPQS